MNQRVSLFLLCSVFFFGCSKSDQAPEGSASTEQGTEVEKATYVQKTKQEVDQWSAKVKSIEDKSKAGGMKVRQDVDVYVQKARKNLSDAKRGLQELNGTTESAWGPLQRGIEEALANLKMNFERATAAFQRPGSASSTEDKS